ncbi:MAG: TIGR02452 family protein [Victivallales bacterium]|nr:TIGR02452 family protein [Victivallales bacterium]
MKENDVSRFVEMYDRSYEQVSKELRNGRKESHWMWYIFPQLQGLGHSEMARYYALADLNEAGAFLRSSCGARMQELLKILLALSTDDPESIFGAIDAMKLASSMTLFAEAEPENSIFGQVLGKYYGGKTDAKTLELLKSQQNENIEAIAKLPSNRQNAASEGEERKRSVVTTLSLSDEAIAPRREGGWDESFAITSIVMTPQEFLKRFVPAYAQGDIDALHQLRRRIFEETIKIALHGSYTVGDGTVVTLPDSDVMMKDSRMYTSIEHMKIPEQPQKTIVKVCDSDSLLAGKKLLDEGYHPAVLNFANRQTAGGGVLYGAGAQEENIFRRSTLALSLYQFHPDGIEFGISQRAERYPMDRTTGGAYSPLVTVFRGAEMEGYPLLDSPYHLGIVTVAAMNRPELKNPQQIVDWLVEPIKEKMRTIFRIARKHGHDALVLGAWGCGAFKNPPQHIAKLFHQVMEEDEFCNRFRKIVFAIVDRRILEIGPSKIGNLLPFQEEFGT